MATTGFATSATMFTATLYILIRLRRAEKRIDAKVKYAEQLRDETLKIREEWRGS
jgi:hypothetical protein